MNSTLPKPLQESESLKVVESYFRERGFECIRIDPSKLPEGQESPDFEILRTEMLIAYAEVKTVEHRLDPETGMFLWTTLFNKLKDRSSKAASQLRYGSKEKLPKIAVFVSNNFQLNWLKFAHFLQGVVGGGGKIIKDFRKNTGYIDNVKRKLKQVDGFMWIQVSSEETIPHQVIFFINKKSESVQKTTELFLEFLPASNKVSCANVHKGCEDPSHSIFWFEPENLKLLPWE